MSILKKTIALLPIVNSSSSSSSSLFNCCVCEKNLESNTPYLIHGVYCPLDGTFQVQYIHYTGECQSGYIENYLHEDITERLYLTPELISANSITAYDNRYTVISRENHAWKRLILKKYRECSSFHIRAITSEQWESDERLYSSFFITMPRVASLFLPLKSEVFPYSLFVGLFQMIVVYEIKINVHSEEIQLKNQLTTLLQKYITSHPNVKIVVEIHTHSQEEKTNQAIYRILAWIALPENIIQDYWKGLNNTFFLIDRDPSQEINFFDALESSILSPPSLSSSATEEEKDHLDKLVDELQFTGIDYRKEGEDYENHAHIGHRTIKLIHLKNNWIKNRIEGQETLNRTSREIEDLFKKISKESKMIGSPIYVNQWIHNEDTQMYYVNAQSIYLATGGMTREQFYYMWSGSKFKVFESSSSSVGEYLYLPVTLPQEDPDVILQELEKQGIKQIPNLVVSRLAS